MLRSDAIWFLPTQSCVFQEPFPLEHYVNSLQHALLRERLCACDYQFGNRLDSIRRAIACMSKMPQKGCGSVVEHLI